MRRGARRDEGETLQAGGDSAGQANPR
jgi:hypothetical protein